MTRICTRFEAITSETFANGESDDKYFKLFNIWYPDSIRYYPIFEAFGIFTNSLDVQIHSWLLYEVILRF